MTENVALWIMSGLQTLALTWAAAKVKKVDQLQDKLEKQADKTIAAKMEVLELSLQLPIQKLQTLMEQVEKRLEDGNDHFADVDEKCHNLEMKFVTKLADAKEEMRREIAARLPGRN
jgi:hypothetical protein